jgi:hypothetical protein
MKKIIFSIFALSTFAFNTQAQLSAHVEQGAAGDNTQQGNAAIINQTTSSTVYTINAYSPFSLANVTQNLDASAVGNSLNSYQFGSANYNSQNQTGSLNTISLTQWNQILGLIPGNGNVSYVTQGGTQNSLSIFQHSQSTENNDAGNLLVVNQNGETNDISISQVSVGKGNAASITQSMGLTASVVSLNQVGSGNIVATHQVDGTNQIISITQINESEESSEGNTLNVAQYGGDMNETQITQIGFINNVVLKQNGSENGALIVQETSNNDANLSQEGDNNLIFNIQTGKDNFTSISQTGGYKGAFSIQVGNGNTATINQSGVMTSGGPVIL